MDNKITGYILLVVGILTIVLSTFSVYSVFTGKKEAIQVFNYSGISMNLSDMVGTQMPVEQMGQMENIKSSAQSELIKPELINGPLNLTIHLFLMSFLVNVGYKVSSLGTQLLRPIKVKLKESKEVEKAN